MARALFLKLIPIAGRSHFGRSPLASDPNDAFFKKLDATEGRNIGTFHG
jgi:hypothetical protein